MLLNYDVNTRKGRCDYLQKRLLNKLLLTWAYLSFYAHLFGCVRHFRFYVDSCYTVLQLLSGFLIDIYSREAERHTNV